MADVSDFTTRGASPPSPYPNIGQLRIRIYSSVVAQIFHQNVCADPFAPAVGLDPPPGIPWVSQQSKEGFGLTGPWGLVTGGIGSVGGSQLRGRGPGAFFSQAILVPATVRNPLPEILHPKTTPIMGSYGVKDKTPITKGDKHEHRRKGSYLEVFIYSPSYDEGCVRVD